ncbi:hypothetical protein M5689_020734 [Euphorbia peplus]|nr:hypothetical protein M5689_020734 [Euphorbia peplus]
MGRKLAADRNQSSQKQTEDDRKGTKRQRRRGKREKKASPVEELRFIKFNPEKLGCMPVLKGMSVDFDSLLRIQFDVSDIVDLLKLRKLLTVEEPLYDTLVQEFYVNMRRKRNGSIRSVVRNVEIILDSKLLERLFELEHVPNGFCVQNTADRNIQWNGYDDRSFQDSVFLKEKVYDGQGNMHPLAKFMHKITIINLMPNSGSRDGCTIAERVVMWHLLNKKPMNSAQQII